MKLTEILKHKFSGHHAPLPEDYDLKYLEPDQLKGLALARDKRKILNHLPLIKEKEEIAIELGLHNLLTPSDIFDLNYAILVAHQQNKISTHDAIKSLGGTIHSRTELLKRYAKIAHLELHPTDVCNMQCKGCTYTNHHKIEHKDQEVFPFSGLQRILNLKPQSIIISGGGEPTLYQSGQRNLTDLIKFFKNTNPEITIALTTNGTYKTTTIYEAREWISQLDWMRISLDSATPQKYAEVRGKDKFAKVMENLEIYLKEKTKRVNIGFLYSKQNMGEYVKIAELMFDKFQATPELLNKITIEYRPFRKNPTLEQTDFSEAITPEQKKETAKEIIKMTNVKPEIIPFLKAQTNITTFTIGNEHTKYDFNKCYFSQVSNIIRPNGEIRPCFMRIEEPEFIIGNILHDPLEKIALNSLYVAAIKAKNCDAQGCRLCYLNHLVQENIGLNPTEIPIEIKRENMF